MQSSIDTYHTINNQAINIFKLMIVCCGISIVPRPAIIAEEGGRGLPKSRPYQGHTTTSKHLIYWLLGLTLTSEQFWEFTRPVWVLPGHDGSTFLGCSLPVIYHRPAW